MGSKSVLLADILSRLTQPGSAREIPGLDNNIAQVLKVEPTCLESLQEETKADSTLVALTDLIITGWPDSMQDLLEHLHPYSCFRDELTILDGIVIKGSRVVIPKSMRPGTLCRLHDAHQGLTWTLQRVRRTVYWPKIQDDISEMVQKMQWVPKASQQEAQTSRMADLSDSSNGNPWNGFGKFPEPACPTHTVNYYSGFLTYDTLVDETTEAVTAVLLSKYFLKVLLKPMKQDNFIYLPNQPVWFTDDDSDQWKPGYIESKDTAPDEHNSNIQDPLKGMC